MNGSLIIGVDAGYGNYKIARNAFIERVVEQVTAKVLANLPTLAGIYLLQQQSAIAAGLQGSVAANSVPLSADKSADTNTESNSKAESNTEAEDEEPEENGFLDFSFGM